MAWAEARNSLLTDLRTLDAIVHVTRPPTINDRAVHVCIPPPASETERRASHIRRDSFTQSIYLMAQIAGGKDAENDVIALRLDEYRLQINGLLDGNLQLDGEAESVSAPSWEELTVVPYPPEAGSLVAMMVCTIEIEIEVVTQFSA